MKTTLLLCLAALCGAAELPAQNLVVNPGFEQWQDGKPVGWEVGAPVNGAQVLEDAQEAQSGAKCVRFDQPALKLPPGAADAPDMVKFIGESKGGGYILMEQDVPVEGGKAYNFTYYYKTSGLLTEITSDPKRGYAALHVWIFWMKNKDAPVDGDNTAKRRWIANDSANALDWTQAVNKGAASYAILNGKPCLAPPDATIARLRFEIATMAPEVAPKVWIDSVNFEEVK